MTGVWISAAVATLVAAGLIGNNRLTVSTTRVVLPGLPPSSKPLRIVHLSDLHGKRFGPMGDGRLMAAVRGCSPDLIAVSGDMLNKRRNVTRTAIGQLRSLGRIAPTALCRGNHDLNPRQWAALVRGIENSGVRIMRNEVTQLDVGGVRLTVAGVEERAAYREAEWKYLEELRALSSKASALPPPRILLAHRPDYIASYARTCFGLSLSGHAHGGQIRLPFLGALWAPDQGFFPRHTEGVHTRPGYTAVISRGLGPSAFPFRVHNPPQIIVLECTGAPGVTHGDQPRESC